MLRIESRFSLNFVFLTRVNPIQNLRSSSGNSPRHQPSRAFCPLIVFRSITFSTLSEFLPTTPVFPSTVVKEFWRPRANAAGDVCTPKQIRFFFSYKQTRPREKRRVPNFWPSASNGKFGCEG